jgi:HlyD family type I secretion membrane fusion protein
MRELSASRHIERSKRRDDGPGRLVLIGGLVALCLLAASVAWASTMRIASAAVATGRVTVEGNRKAIQHRDGGPVEAVLVREGQLVEKGQPLITLDLSDARAQADVLRASKMQTLARLARLQAEATDASALSFPEELTRAGSDPQSAIFMQQETDLFRAKLDAYVGAKSLLNQQIAGHRQQIMALEGSLRATETQLRLVREESSMIQPLLDKGLVTKTRQLALDRAAAELESTLDTVRASVAELESGIREAEIGIAQLEQERHETANSELAEAKAKLAEIVPQLIAVQQRLGRGTLVAPESGYVFNLSVFGPGAVLVPGQTVMEIVPAEDPLVLTVEIAPQDINDVRPGQSVTIHLLAYQQRYQFKIRGTLKKISSDELEDPARQIRYYRGVVVVNQDDLLRSGAELVPGMPVQAMIETGDRTIMAYLLDPAIRMYEYAFREH